MEIPLLVIIVSAIAIPLAIIYYIFQLKMFLNSVLLFRGIRTSIAYGHSPEDIMKAFVPQQEKKKNKKEEDKNNMMYR